MTGFLLTMGQQYTGNFLVQCWPQDNIADYFPVQSCSWAMGEHCTGSFLVQCWHRQIKTTLYRLFSCENVFVRSGPTLHE